MDYSPILAPVVALIAWTLVVMLWMSGHALAGDAPQMGISLQRSRSARAAPSSTARSTTGAVEIP